MSSESKEERKRVRRVVRKLVISSLLLVLALIIPISALIGIGKPSAESPETWFQRSGSIVVLLAVLAEVALYPIRTNMILNGNLKTIDPHPLENLRPWFRAILYIAAFAIIAGTCIWGYGDLLI